MEPTHLNFTFKAARLGLYTGDVAMNQTLDRNEIGSGAGGGNFNLSLLPDWYMGLSTWVEKGNQ